jgi:hypothetical protein
MEHPMKMFSLLTAAALFSSIAVANAAEPVTLIDTQLDEVTAGQEATGSVTGAATAAGINSSNTTINGRVDTSFAPGVATSSAELTVNSTSN